MCGPGDEAIPWLARQHGGRGWGSQVVCCVGVGAGVGIGAGGMARRGALVDESMSMQDEDYLREPSRSGRDREGGQALGRVVREGKRAGGSPVRTFLQLYDVLYKLSIHQQMPRHSPQRAWLKRKLSNLAREQLKGKDRPLRSLDGAAARQSPMAGRQRLQADVTGRRAFSSKLVR
ncbi:hypothetical protein PCL_13077 [Purpureocillium lilacinum]|uniref:Uncharacterized protein n=1 Tax=Purpureocillium lilacinum TaxID=33203 RepID=A0A2U3E824_PURLI|nr:hypothetical protein PCL_13077 [Purpureocillium lilacinum]